MIKFRPKNFSVLSDTVKGAAWGGTAGTIAAKIPMFRDKLGMSDIAIIGGGTVIGAGLGLVIGLVKKGSEKVNQIRTVDRRLMGTVIENLQKSGLVEGKDFTRDPKTANDMKTKVCIVITRNSGELKLLVNTVADAKLKTVANGMIKNIPNTATVNKKLSDKYNDISISIISDSSADAGLITGMAEYFIHHGYPVYLVEVG